jgi:hypothetical protein
VDDGQKVSPLIIQLAVVAVGFALFLACIFVIAAYFLFRKKKLPAANEQHSERKPVPQNSEKPEPHAEHPPHEQRGEHPHTDEHKK